MVGASGEPSEGGAEVDWTVQIHKHRTFRDKVMGRNRMTAEDALSALIEQHIRSEPAVTGVEVERET